MILSPPRLVRSLALGWMIVAVLGGSAAYASAQEGRESGRFWVSGGLGGGFFGGTEGLGIQFQVTHQRARHLFSTRGVLVAEVLGDAVYDLGVLYGRAWTGEKTFFSLGSGLALLVDDDCPGLFSGGECRKRHTVGLPLSLELFGRPTRFFGLGVQVSANLNMNQSFLGVLVAIQLGSLTGR